MIHPALAPGRAAVITGAASGIGLAAAEKFAGIGMKVLMADWKADALHEAAKRVAAVSGRQGDVRSLLADVSKRADVEGLKAEAYGAFGEVALLMNNAGVGGGGGVLGDAEKWRRVIEVNLWGVINGMQVFAQPMIAQRSPAAIVNTGSKQGVTTPPGDAAYNVSKAGVKVATEALAHELRNIEGCAVRAHLLIPGFTHTGINASAGGPKPPGAWTPEQVVDFLIDGMGRGDFYILCPDNEVTRDIDERRILWAAHDIVDNRPALSRWHPDYARAFADYMKRERRE
ncbi:MAG TPA: SDR family NAD(P)-dependent oxidoreductase [Roseiarcus sp.]|nr:SDR family NAD(P)-dependent oxidoreductase [Roseiarcus sp.]